MVMRVPQPKPRMHRSRPVWWPLVVALLAVSLLGAAPGPGSEAQPRDAATVVPAATEPATADLLPAAGLTRSSLRWKVIARGLQEPTGITTAPGDKRLFLTEARGTIRVVKNGRLRKSPYFRLRKPLSTAGEGGLLGLAFHPRFSAVPRFWLTYTEPDGDLVLARGSARRAGAAKARTRVKVLLRIRHPEFRNHFGGHLTFAPDGTLLMGTGDGGGSGDARDKARKKTSLLGKILRLRVTGCQLCAPSSNPFVGRPGRDLIWLLGLRNPWKFWVDPRSGVMWVADVGQAAREEVTRVRWASGARDLGWPCREGDISFDPSRCASRARVEPTFVVPHDRAGSLTGGLRVSRPGIPGRVYVAGDFVSGRVWAFQPRSGRLVLQQDRLGSGPYEGPVAFAKGPGTGVVAVTYDGVVHRLRR